MIDRHHMKLNGIYRRYKKTVVPQKTIPQRNESQKIIGAYHIALFPGWQTIVDEQVIRLTRSGLLEITDHILVGVVGTDKIDSFMLKSRLANKAILIKDNDLHRYEFITLEALQNAALFEGDFLAWYIHTKGVSNGSEGARQHRYQMEEIVIDKYRECLEMLKTHDVCARDWTENGFGAYHPHSPGNFWWTKSSYLRKLPRVHTLNQSDRYEAEFWIGRSKPIVGIIR